MAALTSLSAAAFAPVGIPLSDSTCVGKNHVLYRYILSVAYSRREQTDNKALGISGHKLGAVRKEGANRRQCTQAALVEHEIGNN